MATYLLYLSRKQDDIIGAKATSDNLAMQEVINVLRESM